MKTTKKALKVSERQSGRGSIDRPESLGKPQMKWGSDVVAETTRRLNLNYIALVPERATAVFTTASSIISRQMKIRRW